MYADVRSAKSSFSLLHSLLCYNSELLALARIVLWQDLIYCRY